MSRKASFAIIGLTALLLSSQVTADEVFEIHCAEPLSSAIVQITQRSIGEHDGTYSSDNLQLVKNIGTVVIPIDGDLDIGDETVITNRRLTDMTLGTYYLVYVDETNSTHYSHECIDTRRIISTLFTGGTYIRIKGKSKPDLIAVLESLVKLSTIPERGDRGLVSSDYLLSKRDQYESKQDQYEREKEMGELFTAMKMRTLTSNLLRYILQPQINSLKSVSTANLTLIRYLLRERGEFYNASHENGWEREYYDLLKKFNDIAPHRDNYVR